ncbi:U11/U12 small nuclear ribonucleoprotein 25 kDa protein-like isoform X1 [Homarus americanus]|uniref:U11/U12 small nuclear ribonucleoprotein 25 kDa protein-like isoform X1 n=1 Tax=Homarus americanus TaxID=6706 RepID=UPI001C4647BA|nr:U11/U12 small nuclear ribonucleoprotein 25 kDa protein-like isoform X1 [Homarus americanus]
MQSTMDMQPEHRHMMTLQQEETKSILGDTAKDFKESEETEMDVNDESELKTLSHAELKKFFQGALSQLLQDDPILTDLHPQVTLEEVNALIELEHGRAMKIYVEKADKGFWSVVIPREATVYDLKQGLKHHVALALSRRGVKKKISWRYIWKTYWLCYNGEKLTDDNSKLLEFEIRNKSVLTFVKKYRERQQIGKRNK